MAKKLKEGKPPKRRTPSSDVATVAAPPRAGKLPSARPSSLLDTRVVYCGDNLEQLKKLPDRCVDLIRGGIDPPFNSNRNYEVFWGEVLWRETHREERHH